MGVFALEEPSHGTDKSVLKSALFPIIF